MPTAFCIFLIPSYFIKWIHVWKHIHTPEPNTIYTENCNWLIVFFLLFLFLFLSLKFNLLYLWNIRALGCQWVHVFTATSVWPSTPHFLVCNKAHIWYGFVNAKKADFPWKQTCLLRGGKVHEHFIFISREFTNFFFTKKKKKRERGEGHSGIF